MKLSKSKISFLLIIFLCIPLFAEEILTLDDCINIAKTQNPQLIQQKISIEKSRIGVDISKSILYPSVDASTGFRESVNDRMSNSSFSSSVGASYTIYRGGYFKASRDIAEIQFKIAKENYRLTEQQIIQSIRQSFFTILQKQEQIKLMAEILKRRNEDLILIELKHKSGRESLPAVEESKANYGQAEYDKLSAENEIRLAKVNLNLILGRDRNEPLSIAYNDEKYEFPSVDSIIDYAITNRSEIVSEKLSQDILQLQVKQVKSQYYPNISLSTSLSWGGENFFEQSRNWGAGLNVSLPIFDGYSTKNNLKQSQLNIKLEDVKIYKLITDITYEIEQAYSRWELALKNLDVVNQSLQASNDMYILTRLQYDNGSTSYFFLQQKETELTQNQYQYVNAIYNLRIARVNLEKAWGK